MQDVSIDDPARTAPTSAFVRSEILRVGASRAEVKAALAFVASDASLNPRVYDALPPRMRRLVDLVAVANDSLAETIVEARHADPSKA